MLLKTCRLLRNGIKYGYMDMGEYGRKGEMSSLLRWLIVIMAAVAVLAIYLGIQVGLFDTLMLTMDKRFGNLLAGVGGG